MKRTVLLLLVLALTATGTISCGGEETPSEVTEPTSTTPAETESPYADDLPSDLNFNKETVTFLYREEVGNEFWVEEASGDIVDDAIYDSFRSVEERLNVNIDVVLRPGHLTSVRQEYMQHITGTILSGDSTYDWVDLMIGNSPTLMQEGIFNNLLDNKYIDISKPYYLGGLMENCAIDDRLFFISGDASLGYMKCAFCMYFNQRLADEYKVGNLYDLVDSGKWTMDKLMELSTIVSEDLNADGKYDLDDKLGFLCHDSNHPKGFWASTESAMYKKNSSGEWDYIYGTEHDINVTNKIYKLLFETNGSMFKFITNANAEHQEIYYNMSSKFSSGDIFIMTAELDDSVAQLRDMKDDYGILPYPKFDEEQEEYFSSARNTHNAFSMPVTSKDPDMAGAVLEALSSSNHDTVFPAYFEIALKTKYSRDNDSARMYDIIRDTMILDFGYIYGNAIGGPEQVFFSSFTKENSLASNVASKKSSLETALANYLEKLRETYTD